VAAGFNAVALETDVVVIHDAARPFCTTKLISETVDAAFESGAAIAALSARDTVKEGQVDNVTGLGFISNTLEREQIFLAQTPQAFRLNILKDVIELGRDVEATDEAMLAERAGHRVRLVEGDTRNIKVTTDTDLALAREMVVSATPRESFRVGLGYDLHRLVKGHRLILGGVCISGELGLEGHSDADVVCHAVTDSVLGAVSEGDIGSHFSNDDDRWKDASSIDLLQRAVTIVRDRGFAICNVDIVVIAEWPKIRDHVSQMRQNLATALKIPPDQVSVKGKTNEGVGEIGRCEAIAVHAIASVRQA
jgi:2-C-methyl-D-erythritol 4-phosphate cytidylyltransferase/2-C-methyl-D-erythritol 2,4-cyclodiphosphate synthase